jgi:hypothetical protein
MPDSLGRDFLVLGTLERAAWQQRAARTCVFLCSPTCHDFKEVLITPQPINGWGPAPEREKIPAHAG